MIRENEKLSKNLIFGGILITLIMTPNLNKDSIIIPKIIGTFALAMYFLIFVLSKLKKIPRRSNVTVLVILSFLLLLNAIVISVASKSPWEQLLFGRTGRGLGLIIFFSMIIITIISSMIIQTNSTQHILKGLITSGILSCSYGILQYFNLDFFEWDTRTNGVIGTIGNPNFLSSFAAMIFIPSLVLFGWGKLKYWLLILTPLLLYTIFIAVSTQGYVALITSILAFLLIFYWYKNKLIFRFLSIISLIAVSISLFGSLGHGPLSYYLYKRSVQSRGDFWRSAFETGSSNPFFGVGFDSFGDYSLLYRDQIAASHTFAEYTDSAHNYYLDNFATGGFIFLLLNLVLTLFILFSFFKIQKRIGVFDKNIAALFCAWLVYQLQSLISPMSIVFLFWNAVISGTFVGLLDGLENQKIQKVNTTMVSNNFQKLNSLGLFMCLISLIITLPLFNSDRQQLKAMRSGDGDLLIKAVTSYPESVLKYSQASRDLLTSGLPDQSLYLARKAVEFNPNSVALWALVMINPNAPLDERIRAREKIMKLDPLNAEVKKFEIK